MNQTTNQESAVRRVALVTGGTRGIGLGIAHKLADAGFDLALNGRRPEADVTPVLDELRAKGARVLYCRADIASDADRASMIDAVRAEFGRLDALVNNAGVAPEQRADILDTEAATEASFDRLVSINLRGPYFLTQLAARWMVEQHERDAAYRGQIVFVGSISATVVSTNRGDYCLTKAGIAMAAQLFAARLGAHGIGVYEVRPGVIRTDMTSGVTEKYDKLLAEGLAVEPRWGEAEDVGRAVAVLAGGELTYATGSVIMVDGGLTMQRL